MKRLIQNLKQHVRGPMTNAKENLSRYYTRQANESRNTRLPSCTNVIIITIFKKYNILFRIQNSNKLFLSECTLYNRVSTFVEINFSKNKIYIYSISLFNQICLHFIIYFIWSKNAKSAHLYYFSVQCVIFRTRRYKLFVYRYYVMIINMTFNLHPFWINLIWF